MRNKAFSLMTGLILTTGMIVAQINSTPFSRVELLDEYKAWMDTLKTTMDTMELYVYAEHCLELNGEFVDYFDMVDDVEISVGSVIDLIPGDSTNVYYWGTASPWADNTGGNVSVNLYLAKNESSASIGFKTSEGKDAQEGTLSFMNGNVDYDLVVFHLSDLKHEYRIRYTFDSYTVVNYPPVLMNPIADQQIWAGESYSFIFPENTFEDVDAGDVLTYSTFTYGEAALPAWLNFDAGMRKYSGTPAETDVGMLTVILQATDTKLAVARDTFDIEVISPVTTGTIQPGKLVEIGPVPFSDKLNIQIHRNTMSQARIIIFNMLGEKIIFHPEAGSQKFEIDMWPYASGLYFIRVEIDNETILKKVLKQ